MSRRHAVAAGHVQGQPSLERLGLGQAVGILLEEKPEQGGWYCALATADGVNG